MLQWIYIQYSVYFNFIYWLLHEYVFFFLEYNVVSIIFKLIFLFYTNPPPFSVASGSPRNIACYSNYVITPSFPFFPVALFLNWVPTRYGFGQICRSLLSEWVRPTSTLTDELFWQLTYVTLLAFKCYNNYAKYHINYYCIRIKINISNQKIAISLKSIRVTYPITDLHWVI